MGQMRRIENWPLALAAFLKSRELDSFDYGTNDCLLFSADAVLAITGIDVAAPYRGTYSSETEALALVAEHGDLPGFISHVLQLTPHNNPRQARRGDVVCVDILGTVAAGVVDETGQRCAILTELGIKRVKASAITHVWGY